MVYDCCRHVGQINTIDPVQEGGSSAILATCGPGLGYEICFSALAALPNNAIVGGDISGCLHFYEVDGAAIRPSGILQAELCAPLHVPGISAWAPISAG